MLGFFSIVIGTAGNMTFGVFFEPLLDEFGWTRATLSGAMSVFGLIAGCCNIISGKLTDRLGARAVLSVSCIFSGAGLILLSRITSIWQLYGCFAIIAIGGSGFLIPIMSTVTRWFIKRRGMMTSIVISALGTCEMTMPHLARWLISSYGWRQAYLILGVSVIVFVLCAAQFIRRDPQQMGQLPYGASEARQQSANLHLEGYSLTEALRTRELWICMAIMLCYFFSQMFVATHIVIMGTGMGLSRVGAANMLMVIGGMYILSLNLTGNVIEKVGKRRAVAIGFILQSIAMVCFLLAEDTWTLFLGAAILGLGRGTAMAPMPLLMADIFGLKSFGVIQGVIFFGATAGNMVGPPATGYIFDVTGSYSLALLCCSAVTLVASLMSFFLRLNRPKPAFDS